jgi:hypothetical protein
MKYTKDDDECPHTLQLSEGEEEGLRWLQGVLKKIASSKKHRNKLNAIMAIAAIDHMFDRGQVLHDRLHQAEEHLFKAMAEMQKLMGLNDAEDRTLN